MPKKYAFTVWVCTSGTDYESSGVDAVYADIHGARWWLSRQRAQRIRKGRKLEREMAEIEGRKPDYSFIPVSPVSVDAVAFAEEFR